MTGNGSDTLLLLGDVETVAIVIHCWYLPTVTVVCSGCLATVASWMASSYHGITDWHCQCMIVLGQDRITGLEYMLWKLWLKLQVLVK